MSNEIKRNADGSIDMTYYTARARDCRSEAALNAAKGTRTLLARLPRRLLLAGATR